MADKKKWRERAWKNEEETQRLRQQNRDLLLDLEEVQTKKTIALIEAGFIPVEELRCRAAEQGVMSLSALDLERGLFHREFSLTLIGNLGPDPILDAIGKALRDG